MKTLPFLLFVLLPVAVSAQASAEAEVQAVLDQLLDGINRGDSAAVRATFHPQARAFAVVTREGQVHMLAQDLEAFFDSIGTASATSWREDVWDVEIRVDEGMATAWIGYRFYVGNRLSHCGVNAFQLVRAEAGWQVVQLMDTQRRESCHAGG